MQRIYWWNCLFEPMTPCPAQSLKLLKGVGLNYIPLNQKNVYVHFHQITKLLKRAWENPPTSGPNVASPHPCPIPGPLPTPALSPPPSPPLPYP